MKRIAWVLLATLCLVAPAAGQPTNRPTIALVLSGGGARGFAHVGVLKVLDELHVPVDYIVGTSMGAVVGGLYATGMPYPELERRFREQDWSSVFRDRPDRRDIRLRHKRDDRILTLPFEIGVSTGGIALPQGLLAGAYLTNLLEVFTWPAYDIRDFDLLPIPFRAVATDVGTGEAVVLATGVLPTAIRASMAVPPIFAPVEIDGRTLVDGGVVENLPLRVARELGADVAIVVDISTGVDELPDGGSVMAMAQRIVTIFMAQNTAAQLGDVTDRDVLITPDLGMKSSADFSGVGEAIAIGEAGARAQADALRRLAIPEAEYRALNQRRGESWRAAPQFVPGFIDIDTTATELSPAVIHGLAGIEVGQPIEITSLADVASEIMSFGGFERVEIRLADRDGSRGIILRPVDKAWGPGIVRAGLTLFDRQRGSAGWTLAVDYLHTRFGSSGTQLRADLVLGTVQSGAVELYQPLDTHERWFVEAAAGGVRRDALLLSDTAPPVSVEFAELSIEAAVGVRLGLSGELSVGLSRSVQRVEQPGLPGGATIQSIDATAFLGRIEYDHLDRVAFPREGILFLSEAQIARRFLGGEQQYDRLAFDGSLYRTFGRHTFQLGAAGGTTLNGELPLAQLFTLGELFRLSGVQPSGIQGAHAGLGRLIYRFRMGGDATDGGLYLGGSIEAGGAWRERDDISWTDVRLSSAVYAGIATPLGPLHLAYGFTRGVSPTWILRFGPVF